jgi:hypothetical protein
MKIVVNGKELDFAGAQVSYEEIVKLAGKTGYPTVTYRGPRHNDSRREGEMHTGCSSVAIEPGMVFNAVHTGNA